MLNVLGINEWRKEKTSFEVLTEKQANKNG